MTGPEFRDVIKDLLFDLLGVYTLPGESELKTPAILLIDPGTLAPNNNCSGLEVVINNQPSRSPVTMYRTSELIDTWDVFLVQWDGARTIAEAEARLLTNFVNAKSRPQPVPENKGCLQQCIVKIPQYDT